MKALILIAICITSIIYGNAQGIITNGGYINSSSSSFITIANGGSLTLNDYSGSPAVTDLDGTTTISGHLVNNTSSTTILNSSSGIIEFNGTGTQNIDGPSGFEINNIKISNDVELATDVIAKSSVTLNNAYLTLGGYDLKVENGAPITGYNSSSYIIPEGSGKLLLYATSGGSSIIFPMGTTTSYTPASITLTSGSNQYFKGGVIDGVWSDGSTGTNLAATDPVVDRTWLLTTETTSTHKVDITLQWNASDQVNGFSNIDAYSNIYNSSWNSTSASITGSDPYVLSLTGLEDIDNSTIHAVSANTNPLPIELLDFFGNYKSNAVSLNWITASETDNDFFEIERSTSAVSLNSQWMKVGEVKAHGTTNVTQYYNFYDYEPDTYVDVNYYRLKQVDMDGKVNYSNIIPIFINNKSEIVVYPNPSENGLFYVQGNEKNTISIFNNLGEAIGINLDITKSIIDLSGEPSGIYYINIENRFLKIIKQ